MDVTTLYVTAIDEAGGSCFQAAGGTYARGQIVSTSFSCLEGAGGFGLASCNDSRGTSTKNGGLGHLDTSTLGPRTYTVTVASARGKRYANVGAFTRTAATAGAVQFVFRGRIGKTRLAPGTYRLVAQLTTAAGVKSATVRRTFKIVRR